MAAEQLWTTAQLARLLRELQADRAALERHLRDGRVVMEHDLNSDPDGAYRALGAVAVHAWYTGLEAMLERIARQLDGGVPAGADSHRALLSLAMTEVPGSRPAVLPVALQPQLLELLAFRHFFRHGYGAQIDSAKLLRNLDTLLVTAAAAHRALDAFTAYLQQAMKAASPQAQA